MEGSRDCKKRNSQGNIFSSIKDDHPGIYHDRYKKYRKTFFRCFYPHVDLPDDWLDISGVKGVSTVNLGSADYFAILAKTAITDTPVSNITGNVGLINHWC